MQNLLGSIITSQQPHIYFSGVENMFSINRERRIEGSSLRNTTNPLLLPGYSVLPCT